MAKKPDTDAFADMFARFGRDLKMPAVDVDAMLEHHRKNLEALQKSAAASAGGAAAVMARQKEILESSLHEITEMAQSFKASGSPQQVLAEQARLARKAFDTALTNAGEVAEMMSKSGTESVDILRARIREAMDEIRSAYEKRS